MSGKIRRTAQRRDVGTAFFGFCAVRMNPLRQPRRAVKLSNGAVNLFSLGRGYFAGAGNRRFAELSPSPPAKRPTEFLRIRRALEYHRAGDTDNEQD